MARTADTLRQLATWSAAALLLALAGCSDPQLGDATPKVSAEPAELNFGSVFVGDRAAREVELRNGGRAPVNVAVVAAPEGFLVEPASVELVPGGSARVRVIFAPAVTGEADGNVVLADGGSRVSIEVRGIAESRLLEAPASFDFGTVFLGKVAEETIRLVNRSALPVTLVAKVDGDATAFRPDLRPFELAAGATGELAVQFAPQDRGVVRATLSLSPCEDCEPLRVALRGEGLLDRVVAVPSAIDFGQLIVGVSRAVDLTLRNEGDVPRTVSAWDLSPAGGRFSAGEDGLPATLEPGSFATFPVTFAPSDEGAATAKLRALDETGATVVEVPLAGSAVTSRITVEPEALAFGTRPVDSRTSRILIVKVEGEPIELTAATVEGSGEFRVGTPFPVVVTETREVEVRYEPKAAGVHEATLVLATTHPRAPEFRIPLSGTGQVVGPCRVQVPSSLAFGLVPAGATRRETLPVTNTGTGECRLENFRIDGPAEPFTLEPVATPALLVPGATLEVGVVFAAPVDNFDTFRRILSFASNDPARPRIDLWLSGAALDGELRAVPDPVDFGTVPVGATAIRQVELRNEGHTTLVIKNVALKLGSDGAFRIRVQPPVPATLVPGAGITAGLSFAPVAGTAERVTTVLEVQLEGSSETFRVALVGAVGPCQGDCHSPRPICPGTMVTEVTKPVRLTGTGLDPDQDALTCAWALLSGPPGSRATVAPGGPCAIDFTADLVGDYEFELAMSDPAGNRGTCVTRVRADPYSGLWLETIWDLDADVDLHLLHPNHHPGIDPFDAWSWAGTDGADCFYWTCRKGVATLSWPDSPGPEDDPSLDVDGQHFGPENIRIDVPNRTHPYWIGVHWLYNPLLHPALRVTTNVYCGGVPAATETVTLLHREHAVLGRVDVNPDGTCVFTASDVRLSY